MPPGILALPLHPGCKFSYAPYRLSYSRSLTHSYLISTWFSRCFPLVRTLCDPPALRSVNTLFLLVLPLTYSRLLLLVRHPILRASTRGKSTPSRAAREAMERDEEAYEGLVVACFPVAAFFGWLYYTDLGSLVLVLFAVRQGVRKRWALSAVVRPFFCGVVDRREGRAD
jgi:hypothetical protein